MARYRKVDPRIWNDAKFRRLNDQGKLAFFFLLTHPHMTAIGAMRASLPGLASEIGWTEEAFREAFAEASQKGMAQIDEKASLVWLPNFLKYNPPESPNVVKAWSTSLDLLPECSLLSVVVSSAVAFAEGMTKGFAEALPESFSKAIAIQEHEQEPEQEQDKNRSAPPASPAAPPKSLPEKKSGGEAETDLQEACRETWAAYSAAFLRRYGTEPVRNATVSTQVKQFVKRLGYKEAPLVVEFFVSHPGAFYVKNLHQIGHALKDAEKLRAEWATNRVVTDTQARQSDRTGANLNAADEAIRILEAQGAS